jgi:hypothetical protein
MRVDGKPPIKSITLKQQHEAHGARFYYVGGVLAYLDRLAEKQALETK